MRITPYGIETCCICDARATVVHRLTAASELLPYCASCAADITCQFGGEVFEIERSAR